LGGLFGFGVVVAFVQSVSSVMLDRSQHFAADWGFDALINTVPGALPKLSASLVSPSASDQKAHDKQAQEALAASALRTQAAFDNSFGAYLKLDADLAERRRSNLKLVLAFSDYTHQLRQVLRPLKTANDLRPVLKGFLQIVGDIFSQVERHPDFDAVMHEYQAIVLKLDKLAPNEITRLKILTEELLLIVVASIDRQEVINDLDVARFKLNSGSAAQSGAEKELVRRYEFQRNAIDVRLAILLRDTATLCKIFRLH
jgi:hypothetical protein